MIEDYAVMLRTGRAVGTGIYELTRNGKKRQCRKLRNVGKQICWRK